MSTRPSPPGVRRSPPVTSLAHRRHRRHRRPRRRLRRRLLGLGPLWDAAQRGVHRLPARRRRFMYGVWLLPAVLGAADHPQARRRDLRRAGRRDRLGAARHAVGPQVVAVRPARRASAGELVLRAVRSTAAGGWPPALLAGAAGRRGGRAARPRLLLPGLVRRLEADLRPARRRQHAGRRRLGGLAAGPGAGPDRRARTVRRPARDQVPRSEPARTSAADAPDAVPPARGSRLGLAARQAAGLGAARRRPRDRTRRAGAAARAPPVPASPRCWPALAGLLDPSDAGEHGGHVPARRAARREARDRVGHACCQDPDTQLVMTRAGDDVAFGLENGGVPRRADLAAGGRGAGRGRLPLRPRPPHRARSPAARSNASPSPARSRGAPGCCCSTSRPPSSTRPGAALVRDAVAAGRWPTRRHVFLVDHQVADVAAAGGPRGRAGARWRRRRRRHPAGVFARTAPHWRRACLVPGRPPAAPPRGWPALLTGRRLGSPYPAAPWTRWSPTDVELRAGERSPSPGPTGPGSRRWRCCSPGCWRRLPARSAVGPPGGPRTDRCTAGGPGPGPRGSARSSSTPSTSSSRARSRRARRWARCRRPGRRRGRQPHAASCSSGCGSTARRRQPVHPLRRRAAAAVGRDGAGDRARRARRRRADLRPGRRDLGRAGALLAEQRDEGCAVLRHPRPAVRRRGRRPRAGARSADRGAASMSVLVPLAPSSTPRCPAAPARQDRRGLLRDGRAARDDRPADTGPVAGGQLAVLPLTGVRARTLARRTWPMLVGVAGVAAANLLLAEGGWRAAVAVSLRLVAVTLPGILALATTDRSTWPTPWCSGCASAHGSRTERSSRYVCCRCCPPTGTRAAQPVDARLDSSDHRYGLYG